MEEIMLKYHGGDYAFTLPSLFFSLHHSRFPFLPPFQIRASALLNPPLPTGDQPTNYHLFPPSSPLIFPFRSIDFAVPTVKATAYHFLFHFSSSKKKKEVPVRNGKLDLKEKGDDVVMRKRERRNRGAEVKLEERTTKYLLSSSFVTGLNHRDQLKLFYIAAKVI
uniref:Uncharacterized protein n=1 Tax=Cucumis melo TaxID=3656 RepID=A0A9I9EFB5_CUCME